MQAIFVDHDACCLVRTMDGVEIEKSTMRPGKDGFAEAVFKDGDVQGTDSKPGVVPHRFEKTSFSFEETCLSSSTFYIR